MREIINNVLKDLDLTDQERIDATEFFGGICQRASVRFKKEQVKQETVGEVITSPTN